MTQACGCCEGVEKITPLAISNRPGLSALAYRVGTHATFLETMKARLSGFWLEAPREEPGPDGKLSVDRIYPLRGLTTRDSGDPAIALLDAWALVGAVLTFYQERIANEGYLRTATERRSVLELARLISYALRPGVSASVYLALTLEDNHAIVLKPNELRAQSLPGPGELPQTFENSEALDARAEWNTLNPRMNRPQTEITIRNVENKVSRPRIYLKGISTNLKVNDPVLIDFGNNQPELFRVIEVNPDVVADRTLVKLEPWIKSVGVAAGSISISKGDVDELKGVITGLVKPASIPPRNSLQLTRDVKTSFSAKADTGLQLIGAFQPFLRGRIQTALTNVVVTQRNPIRVYALRVKAAPFGHNAPLRSEIVDNVDESATKKVVEFSEWKEEDIIATEEFSRVPDRSGGHPSNVIYLDSSYDKILPQTWIVVDTGAIDVSQTSAVKVGPDHPLLIAKTSQPNAGVSRAAYGISGSTTRINLVDSSETAKDKSWITIRETAPNNDFQIIRRTVVYAQSEELFLADEPIDDEICGGAGDEGEIELDRLYSELKSGRWLIVSGERSDIKDTDGNTVTGVKASELVMLAAVNHRFDPNLLGDKIHTFIKLAKKLEYCYKRDTMTIYGNVVKANHGETRNEVLGGGDATKPFQSFTLRQPPLTYVASPTPAGAESTLKVFVNDVQWHETDTLAELTPADRRFITRTDDEDKTAAIFGDGERGARLPSGVENIRANYRNGIGKPGNVRAEQISLLVTRPLGVKEVINPLRASGGADKEGSDQARKNAPLTVTALDRLVSTEDYADFARTFAGIGKSVAARISDGRRELVHVTIAGADDIPIDESSDLFRNLTQALRRFGDSYQPFKVEVRESIFLVISARVRLLPDYPWESVVTNIRAKLLDAFSFERRDLAQDALLSEVISAMQSVKGVAYVDLDLLRGVPEKAADDQNPGQRRLLTPAEIVGKINEQLTDVQGKEIKEPLTRITANPAGFEAGTIRPAQLAYLTPDVPETLILNQI